MKFKVGDNVTIIAGKDKGKKGEILKINRKQGRIVVKGVNIITKHIKKTPQRAGQKVQYEAFIDASNAMVLCPDTKKRSRIGRRVLKDGKKERFAKVSGASLDTKTTKKK